jgi:quinol monooxygenase YgiN
MTKTKLLLLSLLFPLFPLFAVPAEAPADGPRVVMVVYRVRDGKDDAMRALLKKHVRVLREQRLATDREPVFMQSRDGLYIEVFEWKSRAAIEAAHQNPAVQALWAEFEAVCEYRTLTDVPEAAERFSEFTPID